MEKERVLLVACDGYERENVREAVARAFALLGGAESVVEVGLRRCIRCFCYDELCEFKAIGMRRPLLVRIFGRSKEIVQGRTGDNGKEGCLPAEGGLPQE